MVRHVITSFPIPDHHRPKLYAMSYLQYHYLSQAVYVATGMALLIAVIILVQMISPRQLPSRHKQARTLAIAAFVGTTVWGAHYFYSEWYFWPDFTQDQQRQAGSRPKELLVEEKDVLSLTEITTIDGEKVILGGNDGTIVVVNFFATWCGPCVQELLELEKSWNFFKKFPYIKFVVVGRGQNAKTVRKFRDEKKYTLPFSVDEDESLFHRFAKSGIPITFLILPDGAVGYVQQGYGGERLDHLNGRLDILTIMRDSSHGLVPTNAEPQQQANN